MASFGTGFARGAARENLAGRFYKTFYYWNRAQATCFEVQGCASNALRRLQTGRILVADRVSDHLHPQKQPRPLCDRHDGSVRGVSTSQRTHSVASRQRSTGFQTTNANFNGDLSSHLRHVMRRVPHAVVVITTAQLSVGGRSAESSFRGMTVSSFNTVTLEPVPIVSFNVRIPSSTYDAILESGQFLVHFLSGTSAGAKIAEAFAKGGNCQGEAFRMLADRATDDAVHVFSGTGTAGAPLMAGAGVMQVLRCRLVRDKGLNIGDHRIVIAEVQGILALPDIDAGQRAAEEGLAYCGQSYRSVSDRICRKSSEFAESIGSLQPTVGLNVRRGDEPML